MLTSLRVKNFQRIKKHIELENLAKVNYLVGENGCGKTSIINSVLYFYNFTNKKHIEIQDNTCTEISIQKQSLSSANYELEQLGQTGKISICTAQKEHIVTKQSTFKNNSNSKINSPFHEKAPTQEQTPNSKLKVLNPNTDNGVFIPGNFIPISISGDFNIEKVRDELEIHSCLNKKSINYSHLEFLVKEKFKSNLQNEWVYRLQKKLKQVFGKAVNTHKFIADISTGETIITCLAFGVGVLHTDFGINTFLLSEPENHLNPLWQKKIPKLLDILTRIFNIQFIVSTHSPFVISSAGNLTDFFKQKTKKNQEFVPPQKVYFIKLGQNASKNGAIRYDNKGRAKGRFGYWGQKSIHVASKMLGAGLIDLIPNQGSRAYPTSTAPVLVLCEGQGKDSDDRIYNTIFDNLQPNVLFVSAKGTSQLFQSFEVMREIKRGLAANFELKMLRDRDHEFRTETEIINFEKTHPGIKILRRRAIECYLYNSHTADILMKKRGSVLSNENRKILDEINAQIQLESEKGLLGSSYKERLFNSFYNAVYTVWEKDWDEYRLENYLASLITKDSEIYQELYTIIFS